MIKPDKIGDIIGPKGKTIRGIQDATGAKISIEDSGLVTIAAVGGEAGEKARADDRSRWCTEPEVGKIYEGPVKSTTAFGAFVEIMPGVEGLLHISELQHGRTEKTEDVVKKGDIVKVKLLEVDEQGPDEAVPEGADPEGVRPVARGDHPPRPGPLPDRRARTG